MGFLLAIVIWALALMTCYFHYGSFWLPPAWSEAAVQYDRQFALTLVITGIAFILAQVMLGWFVFRYRERGSERARYLHGNTFVEVGGIIVTSVVFIGLAVFGQRLWAQVHLTSSPPDAVRIEVTGQQFIWSIRYPGPDGLFGRNSPEFYQPAGNIVGIVPDDPAGQDDIIVQNQLVVPVNTPIELTLRSKDVLHSFFLPVLRIKQDTVPGLAIPMRFKANRTGEFELACAELCGANHYFMQGRLQVMERADYEKWLSEQTPVFAPSAEQPAPPGGEETGEQPAH